MKVQALTIVAAAEYGTWQRGDVFDLPDAMASALIRVNAVIPFDPPAAKAAPPADKSQDTSQTLTVETSEALVAPEVAVTRRFRPGRHA